MMKLTENQQKVILCIGEEGRSVQAIANEIGITVQSVASTIGTLKRMGLVTVDAGFAELKDFDILDQLEFPTSSKQLEIEHNDEQQEREVGDDNDRVTDDVVHGDIDNNDNDEPDEFVDHDNDVSDHDNTDGNNDNPVDDSSEQQSPTKGQTKSAIAREIYERMKGSARKDIIQAFIDQAGLTKNGASTYLQNFKKQDK